MHSPTSQVRRTRRSSSRPGAAQPIGKCDPWLASWQKILTDGPPTAASQVRHEVAYQSKLADIVRPRGTRIAGDTVKMMPMGPPGFPGVDPKNFVERRRSSRRSSTTSTASS